MLQVSHNIRTSEHHYTPTLETTMMYSGNTMETPQITAWHCNQGEDTGKEVGETGDAKPKHNQTIEEHNHEQTMTKKQTSNTKAPYPLTEDQSAKPVLLQPVNEQPDREVNNNIKKQITSTDCGGNYAEDDVGEQTGGRQEEYMVIHQKYQTADPEAKKRTVQDPVYMGTRKRTHTPVHTHHTTRFPAKWTTHPNGSTTTKIFDRSLVN